MGRSGKQVQEETEKDRRLSLANKHGMPTLSSACKINITAQ